MEKGSICSSIITSTKHDKKWLPLGVTEEQSVTNSLFDPRNATDFVKFQYNSYFPLSAAVCVGSGMFWSVCTLQDLTARWQPKGLQSSAFSSINYKLQKHAYRISCIGLTMISRWAMSIGHVFSTGSQSISKVFQPWAQIEHKSASKWILNFYLPMARVMTFSLFRTSLTTMLFCSGVERQQSTERQLRATARNLSSKLLSRA